ncbi:MFS transporter [Sesbania bispinosa]|nr:MFS transporter [Sesbania bispinosa]
MFTIRVHYDRAQPSRTQSAWSRSARIKNTEFSSTYAGSLEGDPIIRMSAPGEDVRVCHRLQDAPSFAPRYLSISTSSYRLGVHGAFQMVYLNLTWILVRGRVFLLENNFGKLKRSWTKYPFDIMANRSKAMRTFRVATLTANPQAGVVPPPTPQNDAHTASETNHDISDPAQSTRR